MITVLLLSPALDVTYLVDEVTVGMIHRPSQVLRRAGGKGLNLARAALRLGVSAHVVLPLGGRVGELVGELARAERVTLGAVVTSAQTRSCVTVADAAGGLTEFYEPAPALSPLDLDAVTGALLAADTTGWTVFSGSVPSPLPVEPLIEALHARRGAGDRVAIDTHGAALATLVPRVRPELLKINRAEAAEMLGGDGDSLELAQRLHDLTGGTVVVTDGQGGSSGTDGSGSWRVAPVADPGAFPVGSGDSFLAGLLVGLGARAEGPLDRALALAAATGAANARSAGAADFDPGDVAPEAIIVTAA